MITLLTLCNVYSIKLYNLLLNGSITIAVQPKFNIFRRLEPYEVAEVETSLIMIY